jgi:hypothetical protein
MLLLRVLLCSSPFTQREEGHRDQKLKCSVANESSVHEPRDQRDCYGHEDNTDSAYADNSADGPVGEDLEDEPDDSGEGRIEGSTWNKGSKRGCEHESNGRSDEDVIDGVANRRISFPNGLAGSEM